MNKKISTIIIYIFGLFFFSNNLNAHVLHYNDVKSLEFDLYRNNKLIGTHIYNFERKDNLLTVNSIINFKISKFGMVLYKYYAKGTELYKDSKLIKFTSVTKQNKKEKFCNIDLKNGEFNVSGSSYTGTAPLDYIIGTWWNHEIVKSPAQISAVSGRIIHQNVKFIGKEKLLINNKNYETLHFNFSSSDKKLKKNKKLNTDIWYDEKTLLWVKASFNKQGLWEYRLRKKN